MNDKNSYDAVLLGICLFTDHQPTSILKNILLAFLINCLCVYHYLYVHYSGIQGPRNLRRCSLD